MAEIVLNVEVRDRTGTGGAREARRAGKVPVVVDGDRVPREHVADTGIATAPDGRRR